MRNAIVIACALAGCGLLPEGTDTRAPSSANAPWQDLGNAVVCLGEQSFGPPAQPPGGLCVRTDATTHACASDRECASRQTCVCGRCTIAFCAAASECDAPRFCNFSQHRCDLACGREGDPPCAAGEQCLGGACRTRCLDSTDCQFGEVCEGNTCIADDCSADTDCLAGERCDLQRRPQIVREPAPIASRAGAGTVVLYLDLADPATPDERAIWRAVSRDGVHFVIDPPEPVLAAMRAPSPIASNDTTFLYVETPEGALAVASATDGIAFDAPRTVLAGAGLHAPAAVAVDAGVAVYYARAGSIALATGALGEALIDQGAVLDPVDVEVGDGTPGTAFWTPITELASPSALRSGPDDAIHVWFSGFGIESGPGTKFGDEAPARANFSIGFAAASGATPGVLSVWPYGPVADRVDVFLTHLDELGPATVEPTRGTFRLYLVDATHDDANTFTLGHLGVFGSGR